MSIFQILFIVVAVYLIYYWIKQYSISRSLNQYSAKDVKDKLVKENILILDVRSDMERRSQFIKGSIHIPSGQLKARINELERHKNSEIICHCHSGIRSLTAASLLQKNGFNSANMKGGIVAWNISNRKK